MKVFLSSSFIFAFCFSAHADSASYPTVQDQLQAIEALRSEKCGTGTDQDHKDYRIIETHSGGLKLIYDPSYGFQTSAKSTEADKTISLVSYDDEEIEYNDVIKGTELQPGVFGSVITLKHQDTGFGFVYSKDQNQTAISTVPLLHEKSFVIGFADKEEVFASGKTVKNPQQAATFAILANPEERALVLASMEKFGNDYGIVSSFLCHY